MSEVNTGGEGTASTESSEVIEGGEGQQTQAETKAEIKAMKERFKYTIDGEDVEEEVDLSDKEGLRKRLQKGYASDKRMGEAKAAKAKAFEIIKAFEEDPANVFKRLGPKGREAAEKFLLEQIQDEMMSPEEKETRSEKAELAELRAEKAKAKEDAEKSEMSAKEKKYADEFQSTIISALEKCKLPKTPRLVADVARLWSKKLDTGVELDADDLAKMILDERSGDQKALVKDMDGEQLIAYFGEEIANKIRMSDLKKLREKQGQVFQPKAAQVNDGQSSGPKKPMSMDEWKESINQRVK
jgi:hypothetical protein